MFCAWPSAYGENRLKRQEFQCKKDIDTAQQLYSITIIIDIRT